MFLIPHSNVCRYVRNFGGHLIVSRSWGCIFLVPDLRSLGRTKPKSGGVRLYVVFGLVSSCAWDGLLFLQMRVALTSLAAHREPRRVEHRSIVFVLQFVCTSTREIVLLVHIHSIAFGVDGSSGSLNNFRGQSVGRGRRVPDGVLWSNIRTCLTAELPQRQFLLASLVEWVILSRSCLEGLFLLELQVTAHVFTHRPRGLSSHSFELDIASVRAWTRLLCLLFDSRGPG